MSSSSERTRSTYDAAIEIFHARYDCLHQARVLVVAAADRAVFDEPTGRLQVERRHNAVIGDVAELRVFAATILTACDQVECFDALKTGRCCKPSTFCRSTFAVGG